MTFQYKGETYKLEFERVKRQIPSRKAESKKRKTVRDQYQTTARLVRISHGSQVLMGEATVGQNSADADTREGGRQAALKKLTNPWFDGHENWGWDDLQFYADLAGLTLQTYFSRPHTPDVKALNDQINRLTLKRDTILRLRRIQNAT